MKVKINSVEYVYNKKDGTPYVGKFNNKPQVLIKVGFVGKDGIVKMASDYCDAQKPSFTQADVGQEVFVSIEQNGDFTNIKRGLTAKKVAHCVEHLIVNHPELFAGMVAPQPQQPAQPQTVSPPAGNPNTGYPNPAYTSTNVPNQQPASEYEGEGEFHDGGAGNDIDPNDIPF